MINLDERQQIIHMASCPEVYGVEMPAKIEGLWRCPHCDLEDDLKKIEAHLASSCD